ncbi:MAG: PIN domain-containing protein [Thermofilaceae archaeon]
MARVALDTSVVVEFIDLKGRFHKQAEAIFASLLAGRLEAVVPHPVLAETYYVAVRVYSTRGLLDAEKRAEELVKWLAALPTVVVVEGAELAVEAGLAKLKLGLALTDCYVLAAAKLARGKALFRSREAEMVKAGERLKEYNVVFLEDYA